MRAKRAEKKGLNIIAKILIVVLFVAAVGFVINVAPNYIRNEIKDKINLLINNNNVTTSLKYDVFVDEKDVVYISTKDIANFFDDDIYYENKYDLLITTSDTKIASIPLDKNEIEINGAKQTIKSPAIEKDGQFYLPFSELTSVYNVEVNYIKEYNRIVIDSLDREQKKGNSAKDANVKYLPTALSKTVDKVIKGESVVVIDEDVEGWIKVRTQNGIIGYLKEVANIYEVRENMLPQKQIEGKVSLMWDYFSEFASAPNRNGTTITGVNVVSPTFAVLISEGDGELDINVGTQGEAYINWARSAGYKVWPMISNNGHKETSSTILNDYNLRQRLINNIVNLAVQYNFDGINMDFEYLNMEDKDLYSRLIIELAPRLKEYGMVLSVDVTAPDGSENWSLCYDRNELGQAADYLIFMAYDQNRETEGTTAGADWVEVNIKKFVGIQEDVPAEKLILGMPLYTRLWATRSSGTTSVVVSINDVDSRIPSTASRVWDDDLKQYYVEYQANGATYKMWIEDEKSIEAKCDLVNKYNLAGGAYWEKDRETQEVLEIIANKLGI